MRERASLYTTHGHPTLAPVKKICHALVLDRKNLTSPKISSLPNSVEGYAEKWE